MEDEVQEIKTGRERDYGTSASVPVYTLNEFYSKIGFGNAQRIYWSILTIAVFMDEIEQAMLGLIIPFLKCEWHLSLAFEGCIMTSVFVLYGIAGLLTGKLSDKFGRKRILYITLTILFISAIGSAASYNKWMFLFFRALTGAAMGANFAVVVSFTSELAESDKRALSVTFIIFWTKVSMFVTVVLAYVLLNFLGWRIFILVISSPLIVAIVLIYFLPESPRFLMVSGQDKEAKKVLLKMAKLNSKEIEEEFELQNALSEDRGKIAMLLLPQYRRETILLSIIYFGNILIFLSFLLFLPMAMNSDFCGGTGKTAEYKCRQVKQESLLRISIATSGTVVGLMVAFIFVDMIGRVVALRVYTALLVISLVLLFKCINLTLTTALLFFVEFFASGQNVIIWIVILEIYPTVCRTTAMGFINLWGKVGGVLGCAGVYILFYWSVKLVVGMYVLVGVLAFVPTLFYNKETKDLQLTDTLQLIRD